MLKRKDENEIAFSSLQELMRRDAERGGVPQEPVKQPKKVPAVMAARHLEVKRVARLGRQNCRQKRGRKLRRRQHRNAGDTIPNYCPFA